MAKTESTAVNELINLVQNKRQPASEPAADLFSAPKSTRVQPPPRMTSTIPPMRGAGEVAPLPRGRAPQSTSQHRMPAIPPPVRMTTADPATGNTIPPLSRPTMPSSANMRAQSPSQRPSVPPPRPSAPPPPRPLRATSSVPSMPSLPPPNTPIAAPFEARRSSPPNAATDNPFAAVAVVPQQFPTVARPSSIDATADVIRADNWFDVSAQVHKLDHDSSGTAVVRRGRAETLALVKKLIAPTIILAIVGIMVGGFFAFDGDGGKKKNKTAAAPASGQTARVEMAAAPTPAAETAGAPVAQPEPPTKQEAVAEQAAAEAAAKQADQAANGAAADEPKQDAESLLPAATTAAITRDAPAATAAKVEAPAPAPAATEVAKAEPAVAKTETAPAKAVATNPAAPVREIKTPTGVVTFVDVRIDSKPSGATVMLVDNGKSSFLGTTPLATSLDPSRRYDVVFTLEGRKTEMAPLDPTKTSRLKVRLSRAKSERRAKKEARAAGLAEPFALEESKPAKAEKKKVEKSQKVEKKVAETKVAKSDAAGEGTLMVSSKPPCEIWIDGKNTGLVTPQRSIGLSAGTHKVTFVHKAEGIKKTVTVQIKADEPTKLIQDLMKK